MREIGASVGQEVGPARHISQANVPAAVGVKAAGARGRAAPSQEHRERGGHAAGRSRTARSSTRAEPRVRR